MLLEIKMFVFSLLKKEKEIDGLQCENKQKSIITIKKLLLD